MHLLEVKALSAEFKVDVAKREVTGYASTFGNIDHGDDRVVTGAFTKTLAQDFPVGKIKVRRNHDGAIGRPIHMEQDSKGLLTVSKVSQTPLGDETLTLAVDGVIDRMSIGYMVDGPEGKAYTTEEGRRVRNLKSLRLDHYGLLDKAPMNDAAVITGVKSLYDVACVLDQMQSAVYALQRLASLPKDVADRVAQLVADLQKMPPIEPDPEYVAEQAERLTAISSLLSAFNTTLAQSARSN